MTLEQKTQAFRELHQSDGIFLLPNAWDVASARLVERLGFPAVATSSAALDDSPAPSGTSELIRRSNPSSPVNPA